MTCLLGARLPAAIAFVSTLALTSCATVPLEQVASRAAPIADSTLPPMKSFAARGTAGVTRSNQDIARDFLDLSFRLESGRDLARFTRFEGPITLRVTGQPPVGLQSDLAGLLQRLRQEAWLDIRQVSSGSAAITIEAVPRARLRRALPGAACFVVPNISSLDEYNGARRAGIINWDTLQQRQKLAIILPADASPQEVRDCLHEELAQALGPLNDLYRLPDSVFNDDNMHTVLTGFDMLILRATYAPELSSGMSRDAVAARLPGILARLNPGGEGLAAEWAPATPRAWIDAVEAALGQDTPAHARRAAARRALDIASSQGWRDHRRAFSHYIYGRLSQRDDLAVAVSHLSEADRLYGARSATGIHRATVATQMAAYAISRGQADQALAIIAPHISTATRHENAALLATLLLLRAEALEMRGDTSESEVARLDSLGWARYGFGADWAVRAKMREIRQLNPTQG